MMSRCRVVVGGALFLMMCGWGVWSVSVLAQSAPATPRLEFDAASVKPNPSSSAPQGFDVRTLAAGELRITATTLRELIRLAYGADFIRTQDQLVGGPSWLNVDRFDVIATVDRSVLAGPGPGGNAADGERSFLYTLCGAGTAGGRGTTPIWRSWSAGPAGGAGTSWELCRSCRFSWTVPSTRAPTRR